MVKASYVYVWLLIELHLVRPCSNTTLYKNYRQRVAK